MNDKLIIAAALTGVFMLTSCETHHHTAEAYCRVDAENLSATIHDVALNKTLYSMEHGKITKPGIFQGDAVRQDGVALDIPEPAIFHVNEKNKICSLGAKTSSGEISAWEMYHFNIK